MHGRDFLDFAPTHIATGPAVLGQDSVASRLGGLGLAAQVGAFIPMMTGKRVMITFERWARDGDLTPAEARIGISAYAGLSGRDFLFRRDDASTDVGFASCMAARSRFSASSLASASSVEMSSGQP